MKKITYVSFFLILAISLQGQSYNGKQKEINKILKNIEQFSQFLMASDTESLVACYTKDGKIFPNNLEILEGVKELNSYWKLPEGVKIIHHKVTPSELTIVKNTCYDYGYYEGKTQSPNGEVSSWKGKYVIVWKKVGKEWKIYLDCWNRIAPPKEGE